MEEAEMIHSGDLADRIVTATKETIERILKAEHASDCLALYMFYSYTAKWQKTSCIKCTTAYTAKGLGWSEDKVRSRKAILVGLELVSDEKDLNDKGKVLGWYIKVNFLFNSADKNPPSGLSRGWIGPEGGNLRGKCSKTGSLNAGETGNLNAHDCESLLFPNTDSPDSETSPSSQASPTPSIADGSPVNGKKKASADGIEWAEYFMSKQPENIQKRAQSNWKEKWGLVFDSIVKKFEYDELVAVIEWALADPWHSSHFQSPAKLLQRNGQGVLYYDVYLTAMNASKPKKAVVSLNGGGVKTKLVL